MSGGGPEASGASTGEVTQAPGRDWSALIGRGVITLVTLAGFGWLLDLPLLGFDAWPLVAAARWEGAGDLQRLLTAELMEGRYPDGHFHRPLVHLSFALDRALHGLDASGYHLTNLLTCLVSAQLVFSLARRIAGVGALAATLAALAFVLHPLQAEVLPFPARRADNLALCLILASLAAAPRAGSNPSRGRALALFALGWAALAAKETGAISALLVPALLAFEAREEPVRATLRGLPTVLGVTCGVAARQLVLGGLAGHADSGLDLGRTGAAASEYLWRMLYPQPALGWGGWVEPVLAVELGLLVAAGLVTGRGRAVGVLLAWLGVLLGVSSLAGRVHDWYALLFVPPLVLLVATVAEGTSVARDRGRTGPTLLGTGAVGLAGALLALAALRSPVVRTYENLEDGARLLEQTLTQVDRLLEASPEEALVRLNPWVPLLPPHSDGSELRLVPLAADYSLAAYLEVTAVDRTTAVRRFEAGAQGTSPDTWTLELVQQPPPSWVRLR